METCLILILELLNSLLSHLPLAMITTILTSNILTSVIKMKGNGVIPSYPKWWHTFLSQHWGGLLSS